ncbi:MAG: hypothetical protein GQ528_05585 [Woeseiaceae bacterium]|nr:hypothetical protein [Woeseiaceae bacterium]
MENRNHENLGELLGKFFDAEQAESYLKDFQEGERIFRDNPAPEPDDMLIANIKAGIAMRLSARKVELARRRVYRRAVAAAAVFLIAGISTMLFNNGPQRGPSRLAAASLMPTAIWESDDVAADDENLAFFATEIQQIENEVVALESNEDTSESDSTIEELEMELMVISGDFWKG